MRGKLRLELGSHGFSIEPLLKHVEACHPTFAHDEELAVHGSRQSQGLEQIGKTFRNILAGAGVEARDHSALCVDTRDGLHPDAVPFPFGDEIYWIERAQIAVLHSVREHRRSEWSGIVALRLVRATFEPGEQFGIGWLQAA